MAAAHEQRLTVHRPVLWRFIKRHSIDGYGDDIYCRFFWTESFQELYVLRIEPRGLGLQWPRRGTTPTVCFPYDGPRGDGASCMINIERLAPNRAYFNLELEALEGDEKRITEIKFDGNRLRCYGGWAVEDSTTVAPTVRARTWLKLDAVLEDGPPPRLLLRVDGQLLYAMPLATRVRLRGVVLKGWANRSGRTNYARLAITDSVACAAARLVSLWLLRRANSDVALVVLAFALPAPLLDMLRANSTALRGKRQWSYLGDYTRDRGGPLPTVDYQGRLQFAVLPPMVAFQPGAPPADAGVLEDFDPMVDDRDSMAQFDRFVELTKVLPTTSMFLLVAMMGELYSLASAKDAYELVMRKLKDTSLPSAVKVVTAMACVARGRRAARCQRGEEAGGNGLVRISSHMLLQFNPPRAPQGPHLAGLVRPERRPARVRARVGTSSCGGAPVLAAHLAAPGRARADPAAVVARVAGVAPATVVAARRREGP